jgi:hypothetical protein
MWPKELIDRKSAVDIVCNLELKMLGYLNKTYKGADIACALGEIKRELRKLVYYVPDEFYPEWRNPETDLPKVETEVLVMYRRDDYLGITTAHYEDGNVFSEDSEWNWEDLPDWGTYDEERDDYRIPKGWWEYRYFNPDEVYNNQIDRPVVGWMPLPPKEVKQ